MLRQAVLPLARPRILSSTVRSSFLAGSSFSAVQHTRRWYAKNGKPKQPYQLPDFVKQQRKNVPEAEEQSQKQQQEQQQQEQEQEDQVEGSLTEPTPSTERETPYSQTPLPDLTQGIPSTLDAELEAKRPTKRSLNLTEDPSQSDDTFGDQPGAGGGGGDRPPRSSGYVSSTDRKRNLYAKITYIVLLMTGVGSTVYVGRDWDTEEEAKKHPEAPSGWGLKLFYNRIRARMGDVSSYYKDPAFPKLLPDEDPQLRQPYTLVISLEDMLVHSEWSREHGWRLAKRPGVDYFLRYLNQYYELVLFTSVPSLMADQVLRKLDPYRIIRWPLFREATRYKDGEYIKVCL